MAPKKVAAKKALAAPVERPPALAETEEEHEDLLLEIPGSETQPDTPKEKEGSAAKEEVKSPSSSVASSSVKRKLQQNMVNQMKNAKKRLENGTEQEGDEERVQIYDRYMALGRFDQEKELLLEQWAKDKSCGWWKTYEESRGQTFKQADDGLDGWGSRSLCLMFGSRKCCLMFHFYRRSGFEVCASELGIRYEVER
jgi:hypothetical protein